MERVLSRIRLEPAAAARPDVWEVLQDGYAMHQTIWKFFRHVDGQRPFLYRHEPGKLGGVLYLLSSAEPRDPSGLWRIESRPFAPNLAPGDRLAFSVRVNPTRMKARGADAAGKRVDVVIDRKIALREAGEALPDRVELVRSCGWSWLSSRQERAGFELLEEGFRAEGHGQEDYVRPNGRRMTLSRMDLSGLVAVRDPERFIATVGRGIGPAKAFGFGLMLLRRVA